ncbi:MAG: hypothetical protein A2Z02_05340 [Chloroflexi bacterium RBG_16_48_7]|nr:MAG: hypothetical protein A2Z02_05340 [Chloroflexi bacterium RBG_16_48_7]
MNRQRTTRISYLSFIRTTKIIRVFLFTAVFSLALSILPSCAGAATDNMSESDIAAVRSYADPATETTLQGLSSGNMIEYTKYCNEAMKAAVSQEILDKTEARVNNQLGSYISKDFGESSKKAGTLSSITEQNIIREKQESGWYLTVTILWPGNGLNKIFLESIALYTRVFIV